MSTTLTSIPAAHPSGPGDPQSLTRKRVLLVEGDGFTRLVLLLRLKLAGFRVDFTSNGMLGLAKLRDCRPEVLLVELKLCGLSGLELIKAARAEPSFGNRPIYAFTYADRMTRATRKQLPALNVTIVDKNVVSREDLVAMFEETFLGGRRPVEMPPPPATAAEPVSDVSSLGAIKEMIAELRVQCERLGKEPNMRVEICAKLLPQVRSVACCAEAAHLPNLARQARALENVLIQCGGRRSEELNSVPGTVTTAVDVMAWIVTETEDKKLIRFDVVVFDEQPHSNAALRDGLGRAGFEPMCFSDGSRVRGHLASHRADVIIINVLLPETHSLGLLEIKQLPLHLKTPVIFGREPTRRSSLEKELPTRGARLDWNPLMVAELVMQALNAAQSPGGEVPRFAMAAPSPVFAAAGIVSQPQALPAEDGFTLFAAAAAPVAASPGPDQTSPEPIVSEELPPDFDTFIPFRMAPAAAPHDGQVESTTQQPVNSIDPVQMEERPTEELPPFDLFVRADSVAQAGGGQDHAVSGSAPAQETEPSDPNALSQYRIQSSLSADAPFASSTVQIEHMNDQLQATSPKATPQNGQRQTGQPIRRNPPPQQEFAAQLYEREAALQRAQAQIEQQEKVIEALRHEMAGLTVAKARPSDQTSVLQVAQVRCAELEQENATLRQALEGLQGGAEQSGASAEAEAELRRQLEAANAASLEHAAACQEAQVHYSELQQQLDTLRNSRDELANRLAEEQRRATDSAARIHQLEAQQAEPPPAPAAPASPAAGGTDLDVQLRQAVAALARATAELAQERGQRQRSEKRAAELNGRMQALHDDLRRTLQAQQEDLARISTLEEQQGELTKTLEQRAADLEQHQAERRLIEEQVRKAGELNEQLHKDVAFLEEANKRMEGSRQELQTRLESSLTAVRDAEARLQEEKAERQRLSEALDAQTKKAGDRTQRDLELSKLESALQNEQVERKRQELELAHARHDSEKTSEVARALRVNLRRQVREPVDELVRSARNLLEQELGDEQKKLAQTVLENVLMVQTRLREPQAAQAGEPESEK